MNFETRLLNEVDAHDCHHKGVPSDQGYLNYLFYTGNLPAETFVETRGDGVVNTVGSLDGSRPRHAGYLPPTHVNIGEYWKIRDAAGYVLGTTRRAVGGRPNGMHLGISPSICRSSVGRDLDVHSGVYSSSRAAGWGMRSIGRQPPPAAFSAKGTRARRGSRTRVPD